MLERFSYHPDPDNPGWYVRPQTDDDRFLDAYGPLRARAESETLSRLQLTPGNRHRNILNGIHGGFLLAVIDHALFVGPAVQGRERIEGATTIDLSTQFLAPTHPNEPIEVLVETLRETYRMVFVRGTIEQRGSAVAAFSGTIKKASANT